MVDRIILLEKLTLVGSLGSLRAVGLDGAMNWQLKDVSAKRLSLLRYAVHGFSKQGIALGPSQSTVLSTCSPDGIWRRLNVAHSPLNDSRSNAGKAHRPGFTVSDHEDGSNPVLESAVTGSTFANCGVEKCLLKQ